MVECYSKKSKGYLLTKTNKNSILLKSEGVKIHPTKVYYEWIIYF